MKSEDLSIFMAIEDIYHQLPEPRSRHWTASSTGRRDLVKRILSLIEPGDDLIDHIVRCFDNYGKSVSDYRELLDIARRDGPRCFWQPLRPDITCSNDLTVEHLIPQSRGGTDSPHNLVIACRSHNSSRGTLPMEEFIGRFSENS